MFVSVRGSGELDIRKVGKVRALVMSARTWSTLVPFDIEQRVGKSCRPFRGGKRENKFTPFQISHFVTSYVPVLVTSSARGTSFRD